MTPLSTIVANRKRAPRVPVAEMRERIRRTATAIFSRVGYDGVGVREIAAEAGVDPAVVIRSFGSKEALFAAVVEDAFGIESPFDGPPNTMGERIAVFLMPDAHPDPTSLGEFGLLLRSAASLTAGPILSRALHTGFIGPLARHLGGKEAEIRAALLTATVLGFATLHHAIGSPAFAGEREAVVRRLGQALQACI